MKEVNFTSVLQWKVTAEFGTHAMIKDGKKR